MIEYESRILPLISKALASQAREGSDTLEEVATTTEKQPLDVKRLDEIIDRGMA